MVWALPDVRTYTISTTAVWIKEFLWLLYPTSEIELAEAENNVLSYLETPYKTQCVNIGPVVGEKDCKIRTLYMNIKAKKTPIVLLHGFNYALGVWIFNLDSIAAVGRPVYAIDLPGFGRSSRLDFSTDALKTEKQLVDCIEAWRKEMKLEKFILLGFSMGGFISTSYAFRFPYRLQQLILVDPWGFPKEPSGMTFLDARLQPPTIPLLMGIMAQLLTILPVSPLAFLRVAGMLRFGNLLTWVLINGNSYPNTIHDNSKDINKQMLVFSILPWTEKFSTLGGNGIRKMTEYIFHCNAQPPSAENALVSMSSKSGMHWAKFPMSDRISVSLDKNIPLTFIYGTKSFVYITPVSEIKKMRPNSFVDDQVIPGANHDCYAWESEIFNKIVRQACAYFDKNIEKKLSPGQI